MTPWGVAKKVVWGTIVDTNQVPATWFESDAGIRRLASRWSDGPEWGRRRRFGDGSRPACQ
jgi:hypothetical protein